MGTLAALEEHVGMCEFALLTCPNECKSHGEPRFIQRKDIDKHMAEECPNRDYKCETCGERGTFHYITQVHYGVCGLQIISCPKVGCTDTMQRRHVKEHIATECDYTVITCKFKRLGCETELKRKDMTAHEEDDKLHLHMAINMTAKLEKKLENTKEKTARLQKDLEDMTAKLEDTKDKTAELEKELEHMQDKTAKLKTKIERRQLKFKLTHFQAIREHDHRVESPSYHTSPKGYNMVLRVDVNGSGSGKGTHLSVCALIREGKHDANLKWPFVGRITFTLLNQLEDKNHHHKVMEITRDRNAQVGSAWGKHTFISHSKLDYDPGKNTQYLKDDTLYFSVSVEQADHKPWLE